MNETVLGSQYELFAEIADKLEENDSWYVRSENKDSGNDLFLLTRAYELDSSSPEDQYTLLWSVGLEDETHLLSIPVSGLGEAGLTQVDIIVSLIQLGEIRLNDLPEPNQGLVELLWDGILQNIQRVATEQGLLLVEEITDDKSVLRFPQLVRGERLNVPVEEIEEREVPDCKYADRRVAYAIFLSELDSIASEIGVPREELVETSGNINGVDTVLFKSIIRKDGESYILMEQLASMVDRYPEFWVFGDNKNGSPNKMRNRKGRIVHFSTDDGDICLDVTLREAEVIELFLDDEEQSGELSIDRILQKTRIYTSHQWRNAIKSFHSSINSYGYKASIEIEQISHNSDTGAKLKGLRLPLPVLKVD